MPGSPDLLRKLGSIEELLHQIESTADPSLRSTVQELMELTMNLHGAGLERMIETIRAAGEPGDAVIQKLCRDELVAGLMVLYGVHPLSLEARVTQALDKMRPRLRPHGGEVDLVSVQEGAVRLRLHAKSQGCGGTAQTLESMVEESVYQAAPDLTTLTIESAAEKQAFVPLEMLRNSRPAALALDGVAEAAGKGGL